MPGGGHCGGLARRTTRHDDGHSPMMMVVGGGDTWRMTRTKMRKMVGRMKTGGQDDADEARDGSRVMPLEWMCTL